MKKIIFIGCLICWLFQTVVAFGGICNASVQHVECWERFEISFKHAEKGNPFLVKLSATFAYNGEKKTVDGFYDGNDIYKIRFMPTNAGEWSYTTSSM